MKIIRIYAMWCMSCLVMHNHLNDLEKEYNLEFIDLDIDTNDVRSYDIGKTIPVNIILDKDGNEYERIIGEVSKRKLKKILEAANEKIN